MSEAGRELKEQDAEIKRLSGINAEMLDVLRHAVGKLDGETRAFLGMDQRQLPAGA